MDLKPNSNMMSPFEKVEDDFDEDVGEELFKTENINVRSDISDPKAMADFMEYASLYQDNNFSVGKILGDRIQFELENNLSKNRGSRNEYVRIKVASFIGERLQDELNPIDPEEFFEKKSKLRRSKRKNINK